MPSAGRPTRPSGRSRAGHPPGGASADAAGHRLAAAAGGPPGPAARRRRPWSDAAEGRVEIVPCRSIPALLHAAWPVDTLMIVGQAGWGVRRAARGVAPDVTIVPSRPSVAAQPASTSQPRRSRQGDEHAEHPAPACAAAPRAPTLRTGSRRPRPRRRARGHLSVGALGVVYGDIGTSPLYTVQLIFSGDHPMAFPAAGLRRPVAHLLGAGTDRHAQVRAPDPARRQPRRGRDHGAGRPDRARRQARRKTGLVMVGVLGASLFYGDGMLTPAISVVSAVSGLKVASPALATRSSRSRSRS